MQNLLCYAIKILILTTEMSRILFSDSDVMFYKSDSILCTRTKSYFKKIKHDNCLCTGYSDYILKFMLPFKRR